ncbi:MAG: hypothetical protein IKO57_12150 [Treponema sp.]|nr:hypothetical protein [Treponema sp.]
MIALFSDYRLFPLATLDATCATKNTIAGDLPLSDFNEIASIIKGHQTKGKQSEMNR